MNASTSQNYQAQGVRFSTSVRRALGLLCAAALLVPAWPLSSAQAAIEPSFTFSGTGFGNGVGMSQWGAIGMAAAGKTSTEIIKTYFTGVSVTAPPAARDYVSVNLDADKATRSSWTLRPAQAGNQMMVGDQTVNDGKYKFMVSGTSIQMIKPNGDVQLFLGPTITVKPVGSPTLLEVVDISGPEDRARMRYRGTMKLTIVSGKLKLVNTVPMQHYLYGVVPCEIGRGSSIKTAAFEAQALCARSYAYNQAAGGELYCTTRHQVYKGHSYWENETDRTTNKYVSNEVALANTAIANTNNKYITYSSGTKVATAYFGSCNGDYTADTVDIWGSTVSYCKSVHDIYCEKAHATHRWIATMTGKEVAAELRTHGYVVPAGAWVDKIAATKGTNGWVNKITITYSTGATQTISAGEKVRVALGLRSSSFSAMRSTPGGDVVVKRYEDSSYAIRKVGTWSASSSSSNSGGTIRTSAKIGNYFEMTFTGEGATWVGPKAPGWGRANVYIDGVYKATVGLNASTTVRKQPLYSIDGLSTTGSHTMKVIVIAKTTGGTTAGTVGLDAIDVYNGAAVLPASKYYEETTGFLVKSTPTIVKASGFSGGQAYQWKTYGKSFSTKFKAQYLAWYGMKSLGSGAAKIYVDGTYRGTVSLKSTTTNRNALIYSISNLDPTRVHTFKAIVTYRPGTKTTSYITLDRLRVIDGVLTK